MPQLRRFHRFTAWIALLAMLLWALMPTAGAARSGAAAGMQVEVCTLGGMMRMWVPAGSGDETPSPAQRVDCPLCCAQYGSPALPSTATGLPAAVGTALRSPLPPPVLVPRLLRWQLSVARAPPLSS